MNVSFSDELINWFKSAQRVLPWRKKNRSPYEVWISEIMLQQTRVEQMLPFYFNFMKLFPNVISLANAPLEQVVKAWEGLGYYSRARNLHYAAQQIRDEYKGVFPDAYNDIIKLKGIGPYTAAAIASTVFGEKQACVDGNVYRVLSRVYDIDKDVSDANALKYFKEFSETLMEKDFGAYNEALMELGALICLPKGAKCNECPVADFCALKGSELKYERPVKSKKVRVKVLDFDQFLIFNEEGLLLEKGFEGNIWKDLFIFPSKISRGKKVKHFEKINHKLTHRSLNITFKVIFDDSINKDSRFVLWGDLKQKPMAKPIVNFLDKINLNEFR